MKTLKISLFIAAIVLVACKNEVKVEEKDSSVVWAENAFFEFPMEKDSLMNSYPNLSNASNSFDREKIFKSITDAVMSGKMKAYKNYPNDALSVDDVKNILVKWDTAQIENPEKPGEFVLAPLKSEITSFHIPLLKFNETVSFDTLSYSIKKTVSYVSLYTYKMTETGETVGVAKLFDVK
ncbi:MAG: hypothetical protein IT234_07880 [Bacteroidia bacterium]|nr:hypothetical protein [Bacteroidia bacterium]